jgi:ferredoxin
LTISEEVKAQLVSEAQFHETSLQHLHPTDLPATQGSMMLKDETICIRCGLCAARCPAHTITMEAFQVFDQDPNQSEPEVQAA